MINTLVFNNSQRFLNDIYLPLSITSTNERRIKVKIDGFPQSISDDFGNVLITDTAGMGKSTLMKVIFTDSILKKNGIPIFIELRRLNRNKTILDEIKEQLDSINKKFDTDLLLELLSEGGFILILDGYDEISLNDREFVTGNLQEFISKTSNNRFFITSRPEKALASFGNFQEFKILPLTRKEAFELLRKYDNKGTISSLLIKKLQEKEMVGIGEFLTNPLLVSLLFTAFEYKQAIPFKKYLFYRQVYDANFESHDLTKGDSFIHNKYCKLEIDDFHRVLRHIGYNCFKQQRIEFSKDEILKLISESKAFCAGIDFKESDFLSDLIKTVPLFTQDGNYYRWSHKSLQEYFAAQFIYLDSKDKQNDILKKIYNHPHLEKLINVLDLYYDMDYKTFRNIIEFDILNEYNNHVTTNYLGDYNVEINTLNRRKELSFLNIGYLFKGTKNGEAHPFNDDEIDEMLHNIGHKETIYDRILISELIPNTLYGAHFQYSKVHILYLLANKKNPIIKEIKER
ncbi:MAG: NACHT domain-containing protein, partial [Flavobacterium sp.]